MSENLRVAVIGAGRMGTDHVQRLHHRIRGAEVAAVVDVDAARAQAAVEGIDGAVALTEADTAFDRADVNAVLVATPGFLHEDILHKALRRNLPVLCEKPLTQDAASSWNIVQAEAELGRQLIQVGFMRRYDQGYSQLREIIQSGELGDLLMLHCAHRNPYVPDNFTEGNVITEAAVHEFDIIRFLTGEEITGVQVRRGRTTRHPGLGLSDPQQVLIETAGGTLADVEVFVNAQFGYQVATEAVFERGIVNIGGDSGPYIRSAGRWGGSIAAGFEDRFSAAYDREFQVWADSTREGRVDGPTAWDGYAAAACCEAGLEAQRTGNPIKVSLNQKPALYGE